MSSRTAVHRVDVARVHRVRGADGAGALELVVGDVDGDDRRRADEPRSLHRGEADPAATDDRDRRARLHRRGVHHGADAGGDRTADEGGDVERHVVADLRHRVLVHQHLLGERAERPERPHRAAVVITQCGAGALEYRRAVLAQVRTAAEALAALTAERGDTGDDVITRAHVGDVAADCLHDPRALVPHHEWWLDRPHAVDEVQVAVTKAGVRGAHEHLVGADGVDRKVFDHELARNRAEYGSLHGPGAYGTRGL